MGQLSSELTRKILRDPRFRELASTRARLRWALSGAIFLMFFGFVFLISSGTRAFRVNAANGTMPICFVLAFWMIVAVVALTAFYVHFSNARFDALNDTIKRDFR